MSTLESLVRLHRWQVEERRRQLATLDTLAEKLRQELARLVEERAGEPAAAGGSFVARHVFPSTARREIERQSTLERSLAETEAQRAPAREAFIEALQELKRYEVAIAHRERMRMGAAHRRERVEAGVAVFETFRRASGR